MLENINFDEAKDSQLPFAEMLYNLGYKYISSEECIAERGDESKMILKNIARQKLMEINNYEVDGKMYKFSDKDVAEAIEELENHPFDGLFSTSQDIYHLQMPTDGGKSVSILINGKKESRNFRFIDFKNIENNVFHFTLEYSVIGKKNIRPDIVCFINGIPFAIIENKKSSVSIEEAINQMIRNQGVENCPRLYTLAQIFVVANNRDLKYGTTGTKSNFYTNWKEKGKDRDTQIKDTKDIISKEIKIEDYNKILADLNTNTKNYKQKLNRKPTPQDIGVVNLFPKKRIMNIIKNHILFDGGEKKISRYQQYFAVDKMLRKIKSIKDGRRDGGIVWHTQGSGKSLTMVLFVKALIEDNEIENPRVIVVTDRRDLEKQIKKTFENCNIKKEIYSPKSGKDLIEKIKDKDIRVLSTLIQKFQDAENIRTDFVDEDANIFVLIDEAHRGHGGETNLKMQTTIKNACYIAFTGTPIMKSEKASYKKFGDYIDTYTIKDALSDGVIVPLIYEGRYAILNVNNESLDKDEERLRKELQEKNPEMKEEEINDEAIKQAKRVIKVTPTRIEEVAFDIENHFIAQFHNTGLKGQIVAQNKYAAVLYQEYFENKNKIKTALIISDEKDDGDEDNIHRQAVSRFMDKLKNEKGDLSKYEENIIHDFKNNPDGIEIIIVVNKLLTGFDAPRNTVLYLDKVLTDHNLLQAIARVNRLYENKSLPKTAGYIIDYSENARNIKDAMKLFSHFNPEDVEETVINMNDKIGEMETNYHKVLEIFNNIKNKEDNQEYINLLADKEKREDFYKNVNDFVRSIEECYYSRDFITNYKDLDNIKMDLKKFLEIKKISHFKFADKGYDLSSYTKSLIKIMDKHLNADKVESLCNQIDLSSSEIFDKALLEVGSDYSKSEAIAAQMNKTIEMRRSEDPEYFELFSKKIKDIIDEMKNKKKSDIEALTELKEIKSDIENKKDKSLPNNINHNSIDAIFYRNLKKDFNIKDEELFIEIIEKLAILIKNNIVVDWEKNNIVIKKIINIIDDFFYEEIENKNIKIKDKTNLINKIITLSKNNHVIFN